MRCLLEDRPAAARLSHGAARCCSRNSLHRCSYSGSADKLSASRFNDESSDLRASYAAGGSTDSRMVMLSGTWHSLQPCT